MIDRVLIRRDQINALQEYYKITKYSHIFKKFLNNFTSLKRKLRLSPEHLAPSDPKIRRSESEILIMTNTQIQDTDYAQTTNVENSIAQDSFKDIHRKSIILEEIRKKIEIQATRRYSRQQIEQFGQSKSPLLKKLQSQNTSLINLAFVTRKKTVIQRKKSVVQDSFLRSRTKPSFRPPAQEAMSSSYKKNEIIFNATDNTPVHSPIKNEVDAEFSNFFYQRQKNNSSRPEHKQFNQQQFTQFSNQFLSRRATLTQGEITKKLPSLQTEKSAIVPQKLPSLAEVQPVPIKIPSLRKYFTILEPHEVNDQVEDELFSFLLKQDHSNPQRSNQFLNSDSTLNTRKIINLEGKVKSKMNIHYQNQRITFNKKNYSVAEVAGKSVEVETNRKPKAINFNLIRLQLQNHQSQTSRALRKTLEVQQLAASEFENESFASYTEVKLNKLYNQSKDLQVDIKSIESQLDSEEMNSGRIIKQKQRQNYEKRLVRYGKEIIDITKKKLSVNLTNANH